MTEQDPASFYDALAGNYHLIYADWDSSVERQGPLLAALIRDQLPDQIGPLDVLDCACGIGTQALGLAKQGYRVHATDISPKEIERAQQEAARLGIPGDSITFGVADMRTLSQQITGQYDAVIAFDNALPHLLTDGDLALAARELHAVTRPGGVFLASIRDYDALLVERPQTTPPSIIDTAQGRRVSLQLWDWDDEQYTFTLFILKNDGGSWQMTDYTGRYRALRRATLTQALQNAGFSAVEWLMPNTSGYYQPIVIARS